MIEYPDKSSVKNNLNRFCDLMQFYEKKHINGERITYSDYNIWGICSLDDEE